VTESCEHKKQQVNVEICYLADIRRYATTVRVVCETCGQPFRFLGLPLGLNLNGAAMSFDGYEARLTMLPADQTPNPLEGAGHGVKPS
jgi:hypothetical protein